MTASDPNLTEALEPPDPKALAEAQALLAAAAAVDVMDAALSTLSQFSSDLASPVWDDVQAGWVRVKATMAAALVADLGPVAPGSVLVVRDGVDSDDDWLNHLAESIARAAGHHRFVVVRLQGDAQITQLDDETRAEFVKGLRSITAPDDGVKRLDMAVFRDLGLLQEANRLFFHPLGLALEWTAGDETTPAGITGVWDYRDDPEGMMFGEGLDPAKMEAVEAERWRHVAARRALFGSTIQPISDVGR